MSKPFWPLDREGFIQHYLVSGPQVSPFFPKEKDANQLRYEARLRSAIAEHRPVAETVIISAGKPGRLGKPWRFLGGKDCTLINLSDFYPTMQRVTFDAATTIVSPDDRTVRVRLWGYTAADLYCNGEFIGGLKSPVYKPIEKTDLSLSLKAGKNVIYLACETLGVRDTRSVVGLQIKEGGDGLAVTLPDEQTAEEAVVALAFLEGITCRSDTLLFPENAPEGAQWTDRQWSPDFAENRKPVCWAELAGARSLPLRPETQLVTVRVSLGGSFLERHRETGILQPQE